MQYATAGLAAATCCSLPAVSVLTARGQRKRYGGRAAARQGAFNKLHQEPITLIPGDRRRCAAGLRAGPPGGQPNSTRFARGAVARPPGVAPPTAARRRARCSRAARWPSQRGAAAGAVARHGRGGATASACACPDGAARLRQRAKAHARSAPAPSGALAHGTTHAARQLGWLQEDGWRRCPFPFATSACPHPTSACCWRRPAVRPGAREVGFLCVNAPGACEVETRVLCCGASDVFYSLSVTSVASLRPFSVRVRPCYFATGQSSAL